MNRKEFIKSLGGLSGLFLLPNLFERKSKEKTMKVGPPPSWEAKGSNPKSYTPFELKLIEQDGWYVVNGKFEQKMIAVQIDKKHFNKLPKTTHLITWRPAISRDGDIYLLFQDKSFPVVPEGKSMPVIRNMWFY